MYLKRHIENILKKAEKQSKVVLLTGARQVGKTTSIKKLYKNYEYVTLDNENDLILANEDRNLFFRDRKFPIIIDEVQYAKELFKEIKYRVDKSPKKGQVFITGSQTYELLSSTAESLAGRVSILEMPSLSLRELFKVKLNTPFIPTENYIKEREKELKSYSNLWDKIHRGSMPEMLDTSRDWDWFYRDYIRTYIERDIRKIINIKDEIKFKKFLIAIAARSAQIVVFEEIAKEVGIDIKTVQSWLSVIASSGLVKIVNTYQSNLIKRIIKSPKLFFLDTGLLCHLVGWTTAETVKNGAMAGHIFENFVVSEILKSFLNYGKNLDNIFYYRDKDQKEIDLIIEDNNTIYPIEIKKSATIQKDWSKNFSVLSKITNKSIGKGYVVSLVEKPVNITSNVTAIPIEYI
jgi:predicted AAA+ superfamily ATPase